MEIIDPAVAITLVVVTVTAALVGIALALVALPPAIADARRERLSRRESVPTYYRRLVLAR